jgi:NAD(P)-dependent dehydrogenase (short-subunit alcohol dehydrogenase family)
MGIVSVVTGANSGIGRATALHLASIGHEVYGTVRSAAKADKLMGMAKAQGVEMNLVELDIADDQSVKTGMAEILKNAGRVDVLVNNAGVGGNSVAEECPVELYADVMNVNLYGGIRCIQAVLPGMRERKAGTIVNVTSIVGKLAALAQSPYVTSKWAFEGLREGMAQELAPFGIRVAIIQPGVTKSAIFAKNIDTPNQSGAYDDHYRRMFQFYATGYAQATDAIEVAKVIEHAITTDAPKLRYPCSWGGEVIIEGRKNLSDEAWIDIMRAENDDDYYDRFKAAFNVEHRI